MMMMMLREPSLKTQGPRTRISLKEGHVLVSSYGGGELFYTDLGKRLLLIMRDHCSSAASSFLSLSLDSCEYLVFLSIGIKFLYCHPRPGIGPDRNDVSLLEGKSFAYICYELYGCTSDCMLYKFRQL